MIGSIMIFAVLCSLFGRSLLLKLPGIMIGSIGAVIQVLIYYGETLPSNRFQL